MTITCANRIVIVRRDLTARGRLVASSIVWAGSTDERSYDQACEDAADVEMRTEPIEGADRVEVEAVEL